MRRYVFVVGVLGLLAASAVATAHAQNVQGLSLRAGAALKGSPNGTVDIVGDGTTATVKVDLSGAAETMKVADFKDAKAFVVWAVDMDGYRHNVGTLSDELKLEDVKVDYRVARVYVTAEADAKATAPTGERASGLKPDSTAMFARKRASHSVPVSPAAFRPGWRR